mmetsp:Transcript_38666/g.79296  ORF Transcript_38666/g.79296 Transcript_38666/m.79296 type:complete len:86 (-) Transcript_38666:22-279(-)
MCQDVLCQGEDIGGHTLHTDVGHHTSLSSACICHRHASNLVFVQVRSIQPGESEKELEDPEPEHIHQNLEGHPACKPFSRQSPCE